MSKQELFTRAKEAILEADESCAMQIIKEAKGENLDMLDLLLSGFGDGNEEIGNRFDKGILSLPELIYAAEVMKSVTNTILELLDSRDREEAEKNLINKGTILLATVEGDVHDIGKGIVASTLRNAGFEVIDLGCEVPAETILREACERNVDIIGTSALLTSTMAEQKKLEKLLEASGYKEKFITMVGGAPCTQRWSRKIGADGYSEDAIDAVKIAIELMNEKNNRNKEI